ncbi:MAG: hypothetical protein ACK4ZW_08285 [Blastomonas sp.]
MARKAMWSVSLAKSISFDRAAIVLKGSVGWRTGGSSCDLGGPVHHPIRSLGCPI